MSRHLFYIFLFLPALIISLFTSCSDPVSSPPHYPLNDLYSAPGSVLLAGKELILKTDIMLDLMPVPEKNPMMVRVYIETADSSNIPAGIEAEAVYILKGSDIWRSYFSTETPYESLIKAYRHVKIARHGPRWGPKILVDVIVRFEFENETYLIKASDQLIRASY